MKKIIKMKTGIGQVVLTRSEVDEISDKSTDEIWGDKNPTK